MAARPVPALVSQPARAALAVLALLGAGAVAVGTIPAAGAAPASPGIPPQVGPDECPPDEGAGVDDPWPDVEQRSSGSVGAEIRIVIEIVVDQTTGGLVGDPVVEVDAGNTGAADVDVEIVGSGEATATGSASGRPCAEPAPEPEPEPQPEPQPEPEPEPQEECLPPDVQPSPGQTVCFSEDLAEPLEITTGGSEGAPVHYRGNGIEVPGIRVNADHVVIEGFVSRGAAGTGIEVSGDDITVRGNQVTQVNYAGDDLDGIRFFGDRIQLLDNHVFDLEGSAVEDAHVDCMQTFATSGPGSSDIVIRGNRCDQIRSQCLMAEGPHDEGGSGIGESRNWLFDGNRCDSHAEAQSVALEDIQDVTITNNEMVGTGNKAFALGAGTTGTVVRDNRIGPGYGREVGFDDPSAAEGYDGPPAE